ncbi:Hsp70 family protein [Palleronia sp.]|uniref:Hsp70 family protein n=1 Tax=Palleronia sp. TaxID=1940284 RepID=UPI0035C7F6E2
MPSNILAIDFGTSNSAAAIVESGQVRHIPVEAGGQTLPTAVFFPQGGGTMRIGEAALDALIAGDEGRFMRALKSILGTSLLHESRLIAGRRRTLSDVITAFLRELRLRSEAATGRSFPRALSGRPVRFHSADDEADARAEEDLRACYLAAGFDEVTFLAEPEAAAIACGGLGGDSGIGLIVDIGGGTSDFSAFRATPEGPEILANHGIRLGGTDFDHALSMAFAMPELGLGGELRREMGEGRLPVPRAPYIDLSTWAKIPFLYTPETRRSVERMVRLAVEPKRMERLSAVLTLELGHELAFAVEAGKISANGDAGAGRIAMDVVEPGLGVPLSSADLDAVLDDARAQLGEAAGRTLAAAGAAPGDIARIVLVGGSSLMGFVESEMRALCPDATSIRANAFTAVVDGLALAAQRAA